MTEFVQMGDGGGLPPPEQVHAALNGFFDPLLRRFVVWRRRTLSDRSPIDVAGLVAPGVEAAPRPIDVRGNGQAQLRPWNDFLHTFSRDAAWDLVVGAYGRTWSHQLGAIAEGLRHDWDVFAETDEQARLALGSANRDLVFSATFWGNTQATREPSWWSTAPSQTVREGISSVAQALTVLTIDAVDGYRSPLQLAHDAVATGLLDWFALTLPLNVLQPMIACRMVPPGPVLTRGTSGGLEYGAPFKDFLATQSQLYRVETAGRSDEDRRHDGRASAGTGCPVASAERTRPSAIAEIASLFEWLIIELSKPPTRGDVGPAG